MLAPGKRKVQGRGQPRQTDGGEIKAALSKKEVAVPRSRGAPVGQVAKQGRLPVQFFSGRQFLNHGSGGIQLNSQPAAELPGGRSNLCLFV